MDNPKQAIISVKNTNMNAKILETETLLRIKFAHPPSGSLFNVWGVLFGNTYKYMGEL
jgi:hypothetical protein